MCQGTSYDLQARPPDCQGSSPSSRSIQWVPIELDLQPPLPSTAPSLALRFDFATCDATYVELALREQLPIATQDEALAGAAWAASAGVEKA